MEPLLLAMLSLLLCLSKIAYADNENIRFQKIALEQGLSQEFVTSAFQDTEGFMWFGTQEGLNRYDGYQFKVFTYSTRNENSLSSDWIYSIQEMNKEQLWIGTSSGVNLFNKNLQTFTHLKHDPNDTSSLSHDEARHILKTSNGDMYVGTDGGLNRYIPDTKSFELISVLGADQDEKVQDLYEDQNGVLWIALSGGKIIGLDLSTGEIHISQKDFLQRDQLMNFVINLDSACVEFQRSRILALAEGGISLIQFLFFGHLHYHIM